MIIFVKPLKLKQNIPNFLTCCNLLCGCLAIVTAFEGNLIWAAYLVGIAGVFDFFDGFAARMLKVSSPIGKDLDSLADMVTFGVVPGIVMNRMLDISTRNMDFPIVDAGWHTEIYYFNYISIIGFLITVFSAIRLARFNNDTRQLESFIGLPTPANAFFVCSLPLIINKYGIDFKTSIIPATNEFGTFLMSPSFLIISTIILSFLLIAPIPLFALKFKSFGWKGNEIRYVFLGLSLGLLIGLQYLGIPLIIILYIVLSLINNLLKKKETLSSY
jgi:CDP-diacylglycerol--serine O-phosphatidyltransferase